MVQAEINYPSEFRNEDPENFILNNIHTLFEISPFKSPLQSILKHTVTGYCLYFFDELPPKIQKIYDFLTILQPDLAPESFYPIIQKKLLKIFDKDFRTVQNDKNNFLHVMIILNYLLLHKKPYYSDFISNMINQFEQNIVKIQNQIKDGTIKTKNKAEYLLFSRTNVCLSQKFDYFKKYDRFLISLLEHFPKDH